MLGGLARRATHTRPHIFLVPKWIMWAASAERADAEAELETTDERAAVPFLTVDVRVSLTLLPHPEIVAT
jgi:hypothetical protein